MEAKCEHCDKVYIRKDSLMRHKKTRHGVSPTMMTDKSTMTTTMPIPEKMTSSVEERKIKKKKKTKRFSCWICRRTYGNLSSLDRHRRISCAHKGLTRNVIGEMVYSCGSCAKEYKYRKTLLAHQKLTGHNNTIDIGGDGGGGGSDLVESTAPATANAPANTSLSGDGLSVLLATTLAFARVQLTVKEAMQEINTAVFQIYTKNSSIVTVNENGELDQEGMMEETNARISEILREQQQLCERRSAA